MKLMNSYAEKETPKEIEGRDAKEGIMPDDVQTSQ